MNRLKDMMQSLTGGKKAEEKPTEAVDTPDTEDDFQDADAVLGIDSRTEAERIAEEAGRRFRAQQVKDGAVREIGGPKGLEPTRYGDWEKAGRCFDF